MSKLLKCRSCRRLTTNLDKLKIKHPDWHNAPVPPLGPDDAKLLVLGLAPGRLGANRTGLPFVGDKSASWLNRRLSAAGCLDADGMPRQIRISNAVKCLPPANRPTTTEIKRCVSKWLRPELKNATVILALGGIAHDAVLRAHDLRLSAYPFAHAAQHQLGEITMIDSFHPSPLNTQTGRLSEAMFDAVIHSALNLVEMSD